MVGSEQHQLLGERPSKLSDTFQLNFQWKLRQGLEGKTQLCAAILNGPDLGPCTRSTQQVREQVETLSREPRRELFDRRRMHGSIDIAPQQLRVFASLTSQIEADTTIDWFELDHRLGINVTVVARRGKG